MAVSLPNRTHSHSRPSMQARHYPSTITKMVDLTSGTRSTQHVIFASSTYNPLALHSMSAAYRKQHYKNAYFVSVDGAMHATIHQHACEPHVYRLLFRQASDDADIRSCLGQSKESMRHSGHVHWRDRMSFYKRPSIGWVAAYIG